MNEYVTFNEGKAQYLTQEHGSVVKYFEKIGFGPGRTFKCTHCGWWVTGKNLAHNGFDHTTVECFKCQKEEEAKQLAAQNI